MSDMLLTLIVPMVLGFFLGNYIDTQALTLNMPVWTLTLTFLGFAVGMWSLYRQNINK